MVLCGRASHAATYYVATTGSDSNPGTSAAPFATLQKSVNAAGPGDTIIVGDGTYGPTGGLLSFGVTINKAGTASAPITLEAANKWGAKLDCQLTCHSYINFGASSAYWVVKGFEIVNGVWGGFFSNSGGGSHVLIQGNHIHNIGNQPNTTDIGVMGIYFGTGGGNPTIDGNVIHDIGRTTNITGNHDHGVYTHAPGSLISNNIMFNMLNGWCIQTADGFSGTIANNSFYGADVLSSKLGQVVLWAANSNVVIRNNIFYATGGDAIHNSAATMSGTCSIDHNIVFTPGASVGLIDSSISGCTQASNKLNVDPLLVAPASYNFQLQAGSPAIDAGSPVSGVTGDINGIPRPQGAAYDVGAFEYTGGGTTPPPTSGAPVISGVSVGSVGQNSATAVWTTDVTATSQVDYGPTASYGTTTSLVPTLSTSHSVALSGLTAGTLYHYRVKSTNSAGSLATSADSTFTTTAAAGTPSVPAGCTAVGPMVWSNIPFAAQTGQFTLQFDATPSMAKMDGAMGVSNGAASAYTSLAPAVRFNNTGTIDARNGANYTAASSISYQVGTAYHFRLAINGTAHTYSAYVTPAGGSEQLIGSNYAFRTEQASVSSLSDVGVYTSVGNELVCNVATAVATTPTTPALAITGVASSNVTASGATIGWTTNVPANSTVDYGPTTAITPASSYPYGSSTPTDTTLTINRSMTLSGLSSGSTIHYRARSVDASGNQAVSGDYSFTTAASASAPPPTSACVSVPAATWKNEPMMTLSGTFTLLFSATPGMVKEDAVMGLSNGAAAAYSSLAVIVRFNASGVIDAVNGSSYAALASIPYSAGGLYQFRLVVNAAAHTYSAYVTPPGSSEKTIGVNYAFRTEQAKAVSISNLAVYDSTGGQQVCSLSANGIPFTLH